MHLLLDLNKSSFFDSSSSHRKALSRKTMTPMLVFCCIFGTFTSVAQVMKHQFSLRCHCKAHVKYGKDGFHSSCLGNL